MTRFTWCKVVRPDAIAASTAVTANRYGSVLSPCLCLTRRNGEEQRRKSDTARRLGVRPPDVTMVTVRVTMKRRRDRLMHLDWHVIAYYFNCFLHDSGGFVLLGGQSSSSINHGCARTYTHGPIARDWCDVIGGTCFHHLLVIFYRFRRYRLYV